MADEIILDGILNSLEDIGCNGHIVEGNLKSAIEDGINSDLFVELIHSLCSELKSSLSLQEVVTHPQGKEDAESLQMELRAFLVELHCPHINLTMDMNVLSSYQKRLLVLDYLVSELVASRLNTLRQGKEDVMEIEEDSESVPSHLSAILKIYGFGAPPPNVTIRQIFQRIINKTREVLSKAPPDYLSGGLVTQPLSEEQWKTLDQINRTLTQEYSVRRQMLLTRCDVTIQSFSWSDQVKDSEDKISKVFLERRQQLSQTVPISVARILAAKQDLLTIQKTNDQSVRAGTQCSINKFLIGKVPDRGGRPRETRPPPEMPVFKKRTDVPQAQRQKGGGARGKGRGGGRVQGGWSGGKHSGSKGGGWGHQGSFQGYQGGKQKQQYHS